MPTRDPQPDADAAPENSLSGTAVERLAYTVDEAAAMLGIGRDLIYDEIRMRHLRSKKVGARRIIGRHHILEWLDADERERRLLGRTRFSHIFADIWSVLCCRSSHAWRGVTATC